LLREQVNRIQIGGIVISLVAIYLLNGSTVKGMVSGWFFYALLPIVFWGMAGFFQKISTNHISGEFSTLWFHAAFIPVAIFILIFQGVPAPLALKSWMLVIALGLFFSIGNFAILAAFAAGGKASIITPLTALYPAVGIPLVILFFKEGLGVRESVGIVLALLSAVALAWEQPAKSVVRKEKLNEIHR
jgi:transporter family protein